MNPNKQRGFQPTPTGLWVIVALLIVAVVATSPFWMFLLIRKPGGPPPKAIAVLPLLGEIDAEGRAEAEHLRQAIAAHVARSELLEAVPLDQLARFEQEQKDLRAVGSAVGADLLVTGTVTATDDRLSIQLYLIASSLSPAPSWMNRYELPRSEAPSSLEEKIADEVTRAALTALR